MARVTLAVFLVIDCADAGDAYVVVDDLLDSGLLQEAINDDLSDGRVRSCVVRSVDPELLTAHDAVHDEDT